MRAMPSSRRKVPDGGIGEHQSHVVALALGDLREVRDQGRGQGVPGQYVHVAAEDRGRNLCELVEEELYLRSHLLRRAAARSAGVPAGQFIEVGPLVVVKVQDARQRGKDGGRRPDPALLEAGVVVGTDCSQLRDLLAAEAGDAAMPPGVGKADLSRADLGAARPLAKKAEWLRIAAPFTFYWVGEDGTVRVEAQQDGE
jgi:hypothetical protein